jgi:amidase
VTDAALVLSVMAGRPALAEVSRPRSLRIGLATGIPTPLAKLDPVWKSAADRAAATLRAAGHEVIELTIPYPADPLPVLARWFAGAADDAAHEGITDRDLEPRVRAHVRTGRILRRLGGLRPGPVDRMRAKVEAATADVDVILTPGLAQPGPVAEGWHRRGWVANLRANIGYAPYAALWNLLGWPAAAVPAVWNESAQVPLSVQLVAHPSADGAGEALLLRLGAISAPTGGSMSRT